MAKKAIYRVYVIEIIETCFYTPKHQISLANPQFNGVLECLYVRYDSKTPKNALNNKQKLDTINKKGFIKLSSAIVNKYQAIYDQGYINQIPAM